MLVSPSDSSVPTKIYNELSNNFSSYDKLLNKHFS